MPPVTGPMHLAVGPGTMPQTPAQSGWEVESSPEGADNKQWISQDKSLEAPSDSFSSSYLYANEAIPNLINPATGTSAYQAFP
ncbi:hypothetical protein LTS18_011671 [Coniosporium uncinatum]|uniref:Uncharacterized protein n=1 Tax=Coniosporium uncinatum TaxID=93489 RepID=A0ACC3CYE5_9PEZI|nr:hypothetical protein LTS18_011671 [Coniosporium uncinatum]